MNSTDRATSFDIDGDRLFGIISEPDTPASNGILIAVGGPQYRTGSHRQFTLMARAFAARGIAVMRFDYRGMGDSDGDARPVDDVGDELRAAVGHFIEQVPAVSKIVILGLCDGASAAALYGCADARIDGLVMLNPWVRTEQGAAKAILKHYYVRRLVQPELWRKVLSRNFRFGEAGKSLLSVVGKSVARRPVEASDDRLIHHRMLDRLRQFNGGVLIVLSTEDLTAQEFGDLIASSSEWKELIAQPRFQLRRLQGADHTFSRRAWRDQVIEMTGDWMASR